MFEIIFPLFLMFCSFVQGNETKTNTDAKTRDTIELIRVSVLQQEQLDQMLSALVPQVMEMSKSKTDVKEVIASVKERILDDLFLEKFAIPLDKIFTHDEIKELIGFYKSTAMRKFYKTSGETCLPVYAAIHEVISEVVNGPKKEVYEDKVTALTKLNYQKEMKEYEGCAVLEVYSTFCGPCQKLASTFSELSNEMSDGIKFMKLNLDSELNLSKELEIHSVPTLLFIKEGKIVDRHIGLIDKEDLSVKIKDKLR